MRAAWCSRRLRLCWTTFSNGICYKPNGLETILGPPATPHRAISDYQHCIEQCGNRPWRVRNTVSINQLSSVAGEGILETKATSNWKIAQDFNPASQTSTEDSKNCRAVKRMVRNENRLIRTNYTVWWYGFRPQDGTVEPPAHICISLMGHTGEDYETITRGTNLQNE